MDISKLQDFINGKKTYLVAFSSLIGVLIAWAHKDISNQAAVNEAVGLILAITIRHGVSTTVSSTVADKVDAHLDSKRQEAADDGIKIVLK